MEMDNELGITGKSYTTEFREFNSDIGRWWTPDPIVHEWESPYAGFGNNPIVFTDVKGDIITDALMTVVNDVRKGYNTLLNNTKDEAVIESINKELDKFNKAIRFFLLFVFFFY